MMVEKPKPLGQTSGRQGTQTWASLTSPRIPQNAGEVNNYDSCCGVIFPLPADEPSYPQLIEHSPLWRHIYSHFWHYSFEDAEAKYISELRQQANQELPAIARRRAVAA